MQIKNHYVVETVIQTDESFTTSGFSNEDAEDTLRQLGDTMRKLETGEWIVLEVSARVINLISGKVGYGSLSEIVIRPGSRNDAKHLNASLQDAVRDAKGMAGVIEEVQ